MPDIELTPNAPDTRQSSWEDIIAAVAKKQGVDPRLALSVAKQESGFDPTRKGSSGELGLMQLMPETARRRGVDASDPIQNIQGGVGELKDLLTQHNGDLVLALRRYNGSPQASEAATQPYVDAVLKNLEGYKDYGKTVQNTLKETSTASQKPPTAPGGSNSLLSPEAVQTVNSGLRLATGAIDPAVRFLGGGAHEMVAGIKAPFQAVMHPVNTLNAMGENYTREMGQAGEELNKGNYGQAAIHAIGAVPLGSEAVDIGKQAYSGDWAGAAGRVAGAVALPKLFKAAPTAVRGVGRTATAMVENPLQTASGAYLGSHLGPGGTVAGAVLGAHGLEGLLHGGRFAAARFLGGLMKGGETAAGPAAGSLEEALLNRAANATDTGSRSGPLTGMGGFSGMRSEPLPMAPVSGTGASLSLPLEGTGGFSRPYTPAPPPAAPISGTGANLSLPLEGAGGFSRPPMIPVPEPSVAHPAMSRTGTGSPATANTGTGGFSMPAKPVARASKPVTGTEVAAKGNAPELGAARMVNLPHEFGSMDILGKSMQPTAKFIGELYQRFGKEAAEEILRQIRMRGGQ